MEHRIIPRFAVEIHHMLKPLALENVAGEPKA
jgi:hypothetical protein